MDDAATLRTFGQRVRRLRKQRGWTQADLAERTGLDRSYISGVESGRRNVSLLAIAALARGLDVHPSLLFRD